MTIIGDIVGIDGADIKKHNSETEKQKKEKINTTILVYDKKNKWGSRLAPLMLLCHI